MPKQTTRRKIPPVVAAVIQPVSARLSRIEDLLIEMRGVQDLHLKRIDKLQHQFDELTETFKQRR